MLFLHRAGDSAGGADLGAQGAATALVGDNIVQQLLAVVGGAALLLDVGLILLAEVLQGGEHGVGGSLAQAAQSGGLDVLSQGFQLFDVAFFAASRTVVPAGTSTLTPSIVS